MQYTVKQLKKQLEDMKDEDIVYIERIEDVYFEKHGWKTQEHVFGPGDSVIYLEAFGITKLPGKFIIGAHY